jgi:hypothetical protein
MAARPNRNRIWFSVQLLPRSRRYAVSAAVVASASPRDRRTLDDELAELDPEIYPRTNLSFPGTQFLEWRTIKRQPGGRPLILLGSRRFHIYTTAL